MSQPDRPSASPESILVRAIATATRGPDAEAAIAGLLRAALDATGARQAAAVLWDGERGRLAVAGAEGYSAAERDALGVAVASNADHPLARTAHGQSAILGTEVAGDDGRSVVMATWPLRVASGGMEEPLGAIAVTRPGPWTMGEDGAALLAAFADLVALSVDRARLAAAAAERGEWQERMAHTDALTGLANARTLSRILELEIARASRQGTDLSVALFDVDDLAGANAAVGPAGGDDILREVAAVVADSIRLVDTVARWGGDEFIVVAPGAAGMAVAKRVLDAIAARPAGERAISVSAGIARFPVDGASSEELIAAAEAALRTAKASGPGAMAAARGA